MAAPAKTLKRTVKLIVNLIALLCSIILLVLVAATQTGDSFIPRATVTASSTGAGYLIRDACTLNVGAVGVCAYAYILGGVGIALALLVVFLTLISCITDQDAPLILDGSIHALAAVWWVIGVAVLGTFVARANGKSHPNAHADAQSQVHAQGQPHAQHINDSNEGARVGLVLTALVNAVLYALSLWTNACCCIARYKHETVSMYV